MSDMKEKYERVCSIKDKALSLVEEQLSGDLYRVDAKELGEVADIAKDMAEVIKLCEEAKYYCKIAESMEKNSDIDNEMYMEKYLPEIEVGSKDYRKRMYYKNEDVSTFSHDSKEGKAGLSRKSYMEVRDAGDKSARMKEIEQYMSDLTEDISEMVSGMDANEKNMIKQRMNAMMVKIV